MPHPTRLVVPGRGRQLANPEPMNICGSQRHQRWSWIPGSLASLGPRDDVAIGDSRAPAGAAGLVHDLELNLLDLGEPLPLPGDQVIHLLVQVPDLELRLEIDAVIALGPQPVLRLEPLLAHHDDGRLDRGET